MAGSESKGTVVLALAMNAVIAVAKLAVGVLGGSSAMLAEGAHSVADTVNELFLLTSLRRSARPADAAHPFGYGKERFFWALIAAVGIFVSGSVFSLYQGVTGLFRGGEESGDFLVTYIVLAVSFAAEATSWWKSVTQLRSEAAALHRDFGEHLHRSTDPTVKTVFSEDSAALIGLLLAGAGVGLHQATGSGRWDAAAALAIGLLLAGVAYILGRDSRESLIGEAADPELRQRLWQELMAVDEVDTVVEMLTMQIGSDAVLLAVRLDLVDGLDSAAVEDVSTRMDAEIRERHPEVTQIFLDATRASRRQREATRARIAGFQQPPPA